MTTYKITQGEISFAINAESYDLAATKAARKILNTRSEKIYGLRVTGDHGKSGMFNAYRSETQGWNSVGSNFHIREI